LRFLIGVDNTDSVDSIGTGDMLVNLCAALRENGLGRGGVITRHQLYMKEEIPYTSNNVSICCDIDTDDPEGVAEFCRSYIVDNRAAGASPGLCIIDLGRLTHRKRLIRFGYAAKKLVLTKRDAVDVAQLHGRAVRLSEHGGNGAGVIGALAGCGLRLSGNDGKVKGILHPTAKDQILTVGELCQAFSLSCAMDADHNTVDSSDTVIFDCPTKAVLWNHKPALYLAKNEEGRADWSVYSLQELDKLVD
jgi:hypothetical protein